jgi:superfamily II DNA/RNA helicase
LAAPKLRRGLPEYIIRALAQAGLTRREYQEHACSEALRTLEQGKNVEINLPPGTGKTLISQIIGCIWIREKQVRNKVLCVLPSSNLRQQHYEYCLWWAAEAGLCNPLEITSTWISNKRFWHQGVAQKADYWFVLPELFCNAISTAHITSELLRQVSLVVLDEYDSFSIGVLRAEGENLRFSKDFERLIEILGRLERSYVLMSATPARPGQDETHAEG